jgi:voltage-gated potassium channel
MSQIQEDSIKEKLHEVIFEADTPAGKAFDVILLVAIIASVLVVMLESISAYQIRFKEVFFWVEWIFTIIFTIEYLLRIYAVRSPWKYMTSFFGVVDLLAIIPTYLSLVVAGTHFLLVIRALRLLRVFRIFKLWHFINAGDILVRALRASRAKITIFLFFVVVLVTIIGSVMYLVEGGQNEGFSSIPRSIYWSIVTLTTVGFGDITPSTELGQFLSAVVMILGYAVIAVPTGIVSAEMVSSSKITNTQACRNCGKEGHDDDASHCKYCGANLHE